MMPEPRRSPTWRERIPWQFRIAGKVSATASPGLRRVAERLGAFDHGPMEDPDYVRYWVETHMRRAQLPSLDGKTVLELGPGDSVAAAIVARGHGAARTILVDAAAFATRDVTLYQSLANRLNEAMPHEVDLTGATTFTHVLRSLSAEYLTDGLDSLRSLDTCTIDLSWSQAVLEHVRRDEFAEVVRELRRVHRPDSVTSHRVDLLDHMDRSLHSLRFPDWAWESFLLRNADFYTNRLRKHEILHLLAEGGFHPTLVGERTWEDLPIPKHRLSARFRHMTDSQLLPFEIDVIGRPSAGPKYIQ